MLKTRIYASVAARIVILLVFFTVVPLFFVLYVVCLIGESVLKAGFNYMMETRKALEGYDKLLNTK